MAATKALFYKLDALSFIESISAGIVANADARTTPDRREGGQRLTNSNKESRGRRLTWPHVTVYRTRQD